MPNFRDTRYDPPTAFDEQENWFVGLRRLWKKIKNSKIFRKIKHSRANPYHANLEEIIADTPQQEIEIARQKGLGQYLDKNGVRCYVNFDGTPQEEYEQTGKVLRKNGDVTDRIPRDKNGKLDLMAEEPILISVIPLEGVSLTGHVCMQYKDRVINRVWTMDMKPLYPQYQHLSDYYLVYPSQVGINPKKLIRAMDRHNILNGNKSYNIFTNNCAKNVADVLKKLGVKDINFFGPEKLKLSIPTPGNNPFGYGIEDWCMRHGVPAKQEEIAFLFKHHEIPNVEKREENFTQIRIRNNHYKRHIIKKQINRKISDVRHKIAKNTASLVSTDFKNKPIAAITGYIKKKTSDKSSDRNEP